MAETTAEPDLAFRGIPKEVIDFLRKPFASHEIEFLPKQIISDTKNPGQYLALALPYIDREAASMRLHDSGLSWDFQSEIIIQTPEHVVIKGILSIYMGDRTLRYEDFGEARGAVKQDDEGDYTKEIFKEALTDSFKRVVRLVGIGSYLVRDKKNKQWRSCEVYPPRQPGGKPRFKKWLNDGESASTGSQSSGQSQSSQIQGQSREKPASASQLGKIRKELARLGVAEQAYLKKAHPSLSALEDLAMPVASKSIDFLVAQLSPATVL